MTILAIIRQSDALNNETLEARITRKYPGEFYKLGKGQWLVNTALNPKDLSTELGIVKGAHYGNTLIVEVKEYYGLYKKELWAWLKSRNQDDGLQAERA